MSEVSSEVEKYITLTSKKRKLKVKTSHLKKIGKESQAAKTEEQLRKVEAELKDVENKLKQLNVEVVLPYEQEFKELEEAITREYSLDDVLKALSERKGELYSLLKKRGDFVQMYLTLKTDIGTLHDYVCVKYDKKNKEQIFSIIRTGKIHEPVETGEKHAPHIARLLSRVGIHAKHEGSMVKPADKNEYEDKVVDGDTTYWVPKGKGEEFSNVLNELKNIERKIQVLNAERHIKSFTNEEEKEFLEVQKRYAELMKKKKEMLNVFKTE